MVRALVLPIKDKITKFISNAFQDSQSKDDYREVLELAFIFLGKPSRDVHFSAPGAMHGGWQRFFTLSKLGCSGLNSN